MNERAYSAGFVTGMEKAGTLEPLLRIERSNAKMLKIAKLLQKKAFTTGGRDPASWGFSPSKDKKQSGPSMSDARAQVGGDISRLKAGAGTGASPMADSAERLGRFAAGGSTQDIIGKQPEAPEKDDGDVRKSRSSKDPAVISLGKDRISEIKKQQGTGGAGGAAGGPSDAEKGFYGGPEFGDIQKYWMQMMGKTPSQLDAQNTARESGYGRALQHKTNLDWIRSMLMGPSSGHYGM